MLINEIGVLTEWKALFEHERSPASIYEQRQEFLSIAFLIAFFIETSFVRTDTIFAFQSHRLQLFLQSETTVESPEIQFIFRKHLSVPTRTYSRNDKD